MSEFEKAMIEELRAIRILLERGAQVSPAVQDDVRLLVKATPEQRRQRNKEILERAKRREKGLAV